MKKDIIIIGGGAAGVAAASTAKLNYPEKSVLLIRKEPTPLVPCGIPYVFGTLGTTDGDIMPDKGLRNAGVEVLIASVDLIRPEEHQIVIKNGDVYQFEKLIIATGSTPFVPGFARDKNLDNVFTIPKNKEYLDIVNHKVANAEHIAVIGAGFIGVEVSDELAKSGKKVTLIEAQDNILGVAFDVETCQIAADILTENGVAILTGSMVESLSSENNHVKEIVFTDGRRLAVDAVILSIGYRPNVELAQKSGISINKQGAIKVDSYMRTHQKDIFAAGDCAQKRDFVTGQIANVMLASTACAEARVAAMSLYELNTIKTFSGTLSIYSTMVGNTAFGVAGITEKRAAQEGFKIVTGMFKGMDRHPGKLNNPHYQSVKLVANKTSGLIMGGEVVGGVSAGELTNVLGFIIQNQMTVTDLLCSQIGTQPMLTASPAAYPLIKAAELVAKNMKK